MDRKSVIVLLLSAVLMMLWFAMVNRIWPPKPRPAMTNLPAQTAAPAPLATNVVIPPPPPTVEPLPPPEPEKLLTLSAATAHYTLSSRGGGLEQVEFNAYPRLVTCRRSRQEGATNLASVNGLGPAPILALVAPGQWRSDDPFEVSKTEASLNAERLYTNGLRISKQFQPTSNYLVQAILRLENTSNEPLALPAHEVIVGTAAPNDPREDARNLGIYWHSGKKTSHIDQGWFANRTLGCFPGTPRSVCVEGTGEVAWGAVHNQFFTIALVPQNLAQQAVARELRVPPWRSGRSREEDEAGLDSPWLFTTNDFSNPAGLAAKLRSPPHPLAKYIQDRLSPETQRLLQETGAGRSPVALDSLVADLNRILQDGRFYQDNLAFFAQIDSKGQVRQLLQGQPRGEGLLQLNRLLLESAFPREIAPSPVGYQVSLAYPASVLAPGQSVENRFQIYAGPREYKTLDRLGGQMGNHLDRIMGYQGFFGMFAKALLLSMNGFHALGLGYAMAIIVITIIIKLLFWPLTNASTKSMKRMAALQPQMKALQEKYRDDPAKMNRKLMEFMKEHKVSPLGGCLPMLLQLPVFFGFFTMIRSAIELRGARFLWVCDLSKPDTLFTVPGLGWPFNLLPLLMGATMLWQARLTPPSPGMDPVQQKIMRYMPLMFLVILYNFSAGLTLYWTVQNLLTIAQMKLTKAKDEAKAALSGPPPKRKKKKA